MSQADMDQLARWRVLGARNSEKVVKLAPRVLSIGNLGDNEWAVREQLAIAALDLGQMTLANSQVRQLQQQFPSSPRVDILAGLRLEAAGETARAEELYKALLKKDGTNVSAHQRLVALAPPSERITRVLGYLDIFYADPAAWSLLAELYADSGAYAQSLTALGHVMLIQTYDRFTIQRAGETAYTLGDYQLALKYFLRAIEMADEDSKRTRSWWHVKLSTKRLLQKPHPTSVPDNECSTPAQLRKLNELATERILAAGGANLVETRVVLGGTA